MTSTDRPDDRESTLALLREELERIRERTASHPHDLAIVERRLADARAEARTTAANNERLAATLREAREQIVSLKSEVDRSPSPRPASASSWPRPRTDRRHLHLRTQDAGQRQPRCRPGGPGARPELIINEALNVVGVQEFTDVGEVVLLKEVLEDGDRALVIGHGDEEQVVRLAARLKQQPIRSGDSLLVDRRVGSPSSGCPSWMSRSWCWRRCPTSTTR